MQVDVELELLPRRVVPGTGSPLAAQGSGQRWRGWEANDFAASML